MFRCFLVLNIIGFIYGQGAGYALAKSIKEATDFGSRENFPKRDVMYYVYSHDTKEVGHLCIEQ